MTIATTGESIVYVEAPLLGSGHAVPGWVHSQELLGRKVSLAVLHELRGARSLIRSHLSRHLHRIRLQQLVRIHSAFL
eukprot:COSAG02_NODE_115_length_35467_cov_292.837056_10_plen_78_part_00